jgi:hypothetical protein
MKVEYNIESRYIIKTSDVKFKNLMDAIAAQTNGGSEGKPDAEIKKGNPKGKVGTIGKKSLVEEKTGTVISKQALKKLLADGAVEDNTVYTNFKGERLVVLDNELIMEPKE